MERYSSGQKNDPGGGKYYGYDACDQYDTLRARSIRRSGGWTLYIPVTWILQICQLRWQNVQQALYSYLSVKTSDSLENYYRCEQDLQISSGKSGKSDFIQSHHASGTEYHAECQKPICLLPRRCCRPKEDVT